MTRAQTLLAVLTACLLNLVVGVGFFFARRIDPEFNAITAVFIRVLVNIPFLMLPLVLGGEKPVLSSWSRSRELWLWGGFGVLTVMTYYEAASVLGGARANLMNAGSGLLVTVLGNSLIGQRRSITQWYCAAGALVGLYLLAKSCSGSAISTHGLTLAILSGAFSAAAYLMVAKTGTSHGAHTVVLHWTLVNLAIVGLLVFLGPAPWPSRGVSWAVILGSGVCAAVAQYLTTFAYQKASASLIAFLSLVTPLAGVVFDLYAFELPLTVTGLTGMAIIAVCGIAIPLVDARA